MTETTVSTPPTDQISVRGLTYYRLADGKIVEDDPLTTPELARELAPLLAPAS